ncbi:MAG: ABC transporter ATP-binding protein [Dehalococcoidia bacterium]|nr:ABC transporter ATP-binding protein [Dehalococcoidia bacterium]
MIRLEHVSKRYGNTVAVDDVSLEIETGLVCVLIGPSGCGKTTTLRMINRLMEPTSGRILVGGRDISTTRPEELRRSIGYAIQNVGLFPHMTVAANISVVPGLLHWDKKRIARRVEELLALVGLDPYAHAAKYPSQLSGGEAQRVGVARALAADPPILLMDEPFGAVDPMTRERLQTQFASIQQALKKTVILVTHDLDEAIRLADRIAIMESGRLVQYDTPEVMLARPANKFVHDFVGADHALKRLSRIKIGGYVKPAATVRVNASAQEIASALGGHRWGWVVDEAGRPVGWIDARDLPSAASLSEAIVRADTDEIAVARTATLREALSRMLGNGMKSIPVIDGQGRFLGEITLRDIETATAEAEP